MKLWMQFALLVATVSLAACGFHLRGHNNMQVKLAFDSVFLRANDDTPLVTELRKALLQNKIVLTDTADAATITLEVANESTGKQILSLSAAGKVTQYTLSYHVSISAYDKQLVYWLPMADISLSRTMNYDDAQLLAKEQEQRELYQDMRSDAVGQVLRRLSRARPPKSLGEQ